MVAALVIIASLVLTLMTGIPVAFALVGLSVAFLWYHMGPMALFMLVSATFRQAHTEVFIAIPLFVFMAAILQFSGIATAMYNVMRMWTARLSGGLAIATTAISALLGALSGIGATATVTMGLIALPEMLKKNYHKRMVVGCITAGGALGPVIPPSNLLIIVGGYASLSVGKLFLGGVVPGLLIAIAYCIYIWVKCKIHPEYGPVLPPEEIPSMPEKIKALPAVIMPIGLILLVLGGIYLGITTPTEAAAFGALGAIIIAVVNRQMSMSNMFSGLTLSFKVTAMIMWLVIGGGCYSTLVTVTGTSAVVSQFITDIPGGVYGAIFLMLFITFLLGMFIDPVAICMICIPVFLPVIRALGIDDLWFMLLFSLCTCIGYITPPFGLNIFYMKGVATEGVDLRDIYVGILPFVVIKVGILILCIIFPGLLTWLPSLMD